MHSDTRVMSCLSNCFTSSQNQKFFFSLQRLPAGPSQLRENEAVGHQFLHHHQQQTCQDQNPHLVIWPLCVAGRRDSLLFISWADPSLGSTGEICAFWLEVNWGNMTWSQRWIADLSLGCDFLTDWLSAFEENLNNSLDGVFITVHLAGLICVLKRCSCTGFHTLWLVHTNRLVSWVLEMGTLCFSSFFHVCCLCFCGPWHGAWDYRPVLHVLPKEVVLVSFPWLCRASMTRQLL